MHRTQIYIKKNTVKKMRHKAIDLEITMSELIRRILKVYLGDPNAKIFSEVQEGSN